LGQPSLASRVTSSVMPSSLPPGDRPADHHHGPHLLFLVGHAKRELVAARRLVVPVVLRDERYCF